MGKWEELWEGKRGRVIGRKIGGEGEGYGWRKEWRVMGGKRGRVRSGEDGDGYGWEKG
jgi:hypothetical protein